MANNEAEHGVIGVRLERSGSELTLQEGKGLRLQMTVGLVRTSISGRMEEKAVR